MTQIDDIRARLDKYRAYHNDNLDFENMFMARESVFFAQDIAALLALVDEQAGRIEAARGIIDNLLNLPLDAGHWKDVHIGGLAKRLEVTYDPATWSRVMDDVVAARALLAELDGAK